ncbi:MAG: hypothetical protein JKY01_03145 [Pseudomonadales bacterium]|nr:hypothetical protein [Pseudomonadales bacterium]
MTDEFYEEISALADGEVSELGLRKILLEIDAKPEAAQKWARYHTVKAAFRHETLSSVDLGKRIQVALADEPVYSANVVIGGWGEAPSTPNPSSSKQAGSDEKKPVLAFLHSMGKPLSSAALAASVTLAAVLSWQEFKPSDELVSPPIVASVQQPIQSQSAYSRPSGNVIEAQTVSTQRSGGAGNVSRILTQPRVVSATDHSSAASSRRFQVYMISHANHVSVANSAGMMPFARLVSAGEK